ncbi:acetyltransferase [Photobacterium phosphoreum]|uniref:acetyltransferase n=1 Tax=Photobacterium phosphoreum TaxID=659 RepID=UPI000D174414|nr:acetyltransferase [Photobacterium phosphoreum]PSW36894.1 acetyltransferase [Photobacterium phosphoreum]
MAKLAILGASGHGKVLADIALLTGWTEIDFFDDHFPELNTLEQWHVVGNTKQLLQQASNYDGVIVGIGNNKIRIEKQNQLATFNAPLITLIHPRAVISNMSDISIGSVVMANAVINPFVKIGQACIINTSATVDHDCILADGVHISPGAHLAGGVSVGTNSWIGIGSNIIQLVNIGDNVIVGAGSTVIHSISSSQKVIGSPAKPMSY